ncbi:hypothetical protein HPB47_005866 [Ixodes persulcatus]|uniref:Uncharacterized protein n=1 Tax=Ixodes persulcatus TaxID=34615 RepID=A0AC60PBR8_IXOPE|nr:hypothetical protein HPB47_005866 [Ixodes persulcatus]
MREVTEPDLPPAVNTELFVPAAPPVPPRLLSPVIEQLPSASDQSVPPACGNLAHSLECQNDVPKNLTLVLTNPRPQWCLVDGQPTLALLQEVIQPPDLLAQAMGLAGVPMQPDQEPDLQPPLEPDETDTHQVGAERILRYLQDHQPTVPQQAEEQRDSDDQSEEDEDLTEEENDTRRQAARSAGPPHPPVRASNRPPDVNWPMSIRGRRSWGPSEGSRSGAVAPISQWPRMTKKSGVNNCVRSVGSGRDSFIRSRESAAKAKAVTLHLVGID